MDWRDGAFEPIVAQTCLSRQGPSFVEHRHLSDEDLLERLRQLLRAQEGSPGSSLIKLQEMPSSSCYSTRFGSLTRAYALIG